LRLLKFQLDSRSQVCTLVRPGSSITAARTRAMDRGVPKWHMAEWATKKALGMGATQGVTVEIQRTTLKLRAKDFWGWRSCSEG
jgi:hypothetical protein